MRAWIDTWLDAGFANWNLDEQLRRVRCPVLALHGEHDEYGSTYHPERIAALAPFPTTTRILQGCGHVPHREQSEHIVGIVAQWLAALPEDAAAFDRGH